MRPPGQLAYWTRATVAARTAKSAKRIAWSESVEGLAGDTDPGRRSERRESTDHRRQSSNKAATGAALVPRDRKRPSLRSEHMGETARAWRGKVAIAPKLQWRLGQGQTFHTQ